MQKPKTLSLSFDVEVKSFIAYSLYLLQPLFKTV